MKWLVLLTACAPARYVRPPEELLKEARALSPQAACELLTRALASGDYSSQRANPDAQQSVNVEYQLARQREASCREAEERHGPDSNR